MFKNDFELENYVSLNLTKHERSTIAQLRCGILPLRIETGRYINEPVHDRLCLQCDLREIESETHFLLYCTKYNELRQECFGNVLTDINFANASTSEKLNSLLNVYIRKTAKFLVKAMIIRRSNLYSS